jgi:thiamine pyrophosphokinase
MQEFYSCIFVLTKQPARHITAAQLNGVSRDAGLRGASRAQPALPDPDHTGGGILSLNKHPPPRGCFILQRIIIFANGELPDLNKARIILRDDDYIICADGGTRHASSLDLKPAIVIGDMDSAESFLLQKLQADGVPIELFPRDKNETDLELAIQHAIELDPKEIVIIAALGGRLDQTLANIAILSAFQLATFNIKLDDGVEEIFFCRDQAEVKGRSGDIVSLIPWGEPAHGVQTQDLKWQLDNETLYPEKTRGISNEMLTDAATIKIKSGLLLVVHRRQS